MYQAIATHLTSDRGIKLIGAELADSKCRIFNRINLIVSLNTVS